METSVILKSVIYDSHKETRFLTNSKLKVQLRLDLVIFNSLTPFPFLLQSELILTSHCSATRGLLATDHVILNHGQVTWTTPELAPPLLTTTPHQREDVSALDRFNVHRCPTRRVFSGTGIELMTCLPWLDTLTTELPQPPFCSRTESRMPAASHLLT
ncbi:uncharacterized protein TNCV_779621 [Trichonephila clavipes]|nr:uncharacterized protein TNCV_779621 [Trichonephila clavipes]